MSARTRTPVAIGSEEPESFAVLLRRSSATGPGPRHAPVGPSRARSPPRPGGPAVRHRRFQRPDHRRLGPRGARPTARAVVESVPDRSDEIDPGGDPTRHGKGSQHDLRCPRPLRSLHTAGPDLRALRERDSSRTGARLDRAAGFSRPLQPSAAEWAAGDGPDRMSAGCDSRSAYGRDRFGGWDAFPRSAIGPRRPPGSQGSRDPPTWRRCAIARPSRRARTATRRRQARNGVQPETGATLDRAACRSQSVKESAAKGGQLATACTASQPISSSRVS